MSKRGDRYLATLLFTDIADSTRLAGEMGDRTWRDLLEQHHELVRRQLRAFGGREIDTAGDGFFAAFDAPARAVACALAITEAVPGLGIRVRAGVHMGEVEEAAGKLRGIAVHTASRIAAVAEPGQVLTSGTVRDLVAGSGIDFEDRGVHGLKGVPGEWRLFAAIGHAQTGAQEVAAVRRTLRLRARRRRATTIVALVATAAIVGTTAVVVTRPPPSLPSVDANTAGVLDTATGRILAQVPVGARPDGVAHGEGAIWVANGTAGTVSRIDPSTRAVMQSIDVGAAPSGLDVGAGSVWVANSADRTISRINTGTNRVVQTITVGNGPTGVAVGGGSVWVSNTIDGTLSRIEPSSGAVSATINVGAAPGGLAADATAVWVANLDSGTVSKVDPESGSVVDLIGVGNGPRDIAVGDGAVWVANSRDGTVSRIDPGSDRVTATIQVGEGASGVAASAGGVWVACALDGAIFRIDPATNTATRIEVGSAAQAVAITSDEVWFTARSSIASHRGGVLRVATTTALDSIDPGRAFDVTSWSILGLTNDGLVAFDRTAGVGGASLVPNLAVAIPEPSGGGTTYTFQLRPGITYSDGQAVRPEDLRYAIERVYDIPTSADDEPPPYYEGIFGVEACKLTFEDCDLSAGIVTDSGANTVTFRLTAPDPEFPYKLALPLADAVPATAPKAEVRDQPLPATGPYMVASIDPQKIRLVRNPRFREWSRAARPDGYPDEIVWTVGSDAAALVDMVLAGTADAMPDVQDPARMELVRNLYPAQVHVSSAGTIFFMMNSATPPFDDVLVRRAVNLAIDRGRVVELLGGRLRAQVTCQFLPPGSAGYVPYCPYTVGPNPAGNWTAPDLAAARDLVATSGRGGSAVTVRAFEPFVDAATSIVDVLDQIGLDASLQTVTRRAFFEGLADPVAGRSLQASVLNWTADYPAPSAVIGPIFACGKNLSQFCDQSTDVLMQAALDLQVTDPAAAAQRWTEVDHTIVDLAAVAPLANARVVDLVSASVGDYQRHPQWGILYDQLWAK